MNMVITNTVTVWEHHHLVRQMVRAITALADAAKAHSTDPEGLQRSVDAQRRRLANYPWQSVPIGEALRTVDDIAARVRGEIEAQDAMLAVLSERRELNDAQARFVRILIDSDQQ